MVENTVMRGTVAKRLRREAFRLHRYDKKPSRLQRILRKIFKRKLIDGSEGKLEIYQHKWAPGYRRTYLDLKNSYKEGRE